MVAIWDHTINGGATGPFMANMVPLMVALRCRHWPVASSQWPVPSCAQTALTWSDHPSLASGLPCDSDSASASIQLTATPTAASASARRRHHHRQRDHPPHHHSAKTTTTTSPPHHHPPATTQLTSHHPSHPLPPYQFLLLFVSIVTPFEICFIGGTLDTYDYTSTLVDVTVDVLDPLYLINKFIDSYVSLGTPPPPTPPPYHSHHQQVRRRVPLFGDDSYDPSIR